MSGMTEPEFARKLRAQFDFSDTPEQEAILQEAVQAYERLQQIRKALDAETELLVPGRGGPPKITPLLQAERAQRDAYIRALRALNLGGA
jgi:hypothetical protein